MSRARTESRPRPTSLRDELALEVGDRPENVSAARRSIGEFLARHEAPRMLIDDVRLVASELITNALQHGRPGPIEVGVEVNPARGVTLCVRNVGPKAAIPPVTRWRLPSGLATSGRGLGIVRTLSDEVEVRGDDDHTEVRCRRRWVKEEDAR